MKPPRCDGGCGREALFAYIPKSADVSPLFLCLPHVPEGWKAARHPGQFFALVGSSKDRRLRL